MEIVHKITLDVSKQGVQAVIPMTQDDSASHKLVISFSNGGGHVSIEQESSAALYCKKPDGTELFCSAVCYSENGAIPDTVVCTLSGTVSQAAGTAYVRALVEKNGSTLYSPLFAFRIDGNGFVDSGYTSQSEYSELINLAAASGESAADAEAWAVGEIGGAPVGADDPRYHNNAKYYAEHPDIDDQMSASSEKPVQNKVIKKYVDDAIASAIAALGN